VNLTEALERWAWVMKAPKGDVPVLYMAARAYEAGKDIWWCETHECPGATWGCRSDKTTRRCRMVSRRLCPPIDQKEE
jgi:hypothetical protein